MSLGLHLFSPPQVDSVYEVGMVAPAGPGSPFTSVAALGKKWLF